MIPQSPKIHATLDIICQDGSTLEKVEKSLILLRGLSPKTDELLIKSQKIISQINKISGGEVVTLSVENLPTKTVKQKKRRRLLLLLLANFKDLKSEVTRINAIAATSSAKAGTVKTAKLLATLKGKLGLITIAAAAIVVITKIIDTNTAKITVQNLGCRPLGPYSSHDINLPGLKIPDIAITDGQSAVVQIPFVNLFRLKLDYSQSQISILNWQKNFSLPADIKSITLDGRQLIGTDSKLDFSSSTTPQVVISCR